ncbi:hypothetical protein WJX73_003464 [Symbiochloris irregularis]|uniref:Uncharacterized protein n=1 Tax=Symbiochloris irregularis TaxID=706552 RepID=A0AAW1NL14_9CHLO
MAQSSYAIAGHRHVVDRIHRQLHNTCKIAFCHSASNQKSAGGKESLTALAAARLARLELLADRQAQSHDAVSQQLGKLQIRTRILGRDTSPPLRKVQAESMHNAEVMSKLAAKVEQLDTDVRDTQKLLGALQGATSKQLELRRHKVAWKCCYGRAIAAL